MTGPYRVPPPRLGRAQRWVIGGAIAAVLYLAAVAVLVTGFVLFVTQGMPPERASRPEPFAGLALGQAVFFAGSALFQLGTGALVITAILASKAPPR